MRHIRRIASIAAATLALVAIPAFTAQGQETELFGYSVGAKGTAISFLYNQPSFGVPTDPTFELRKVHSVTDLDSGPASHGLGSVLWPGDVIGNAPPALAFETLVFNPTQLTQLDPILAEFKKQGAAATAGGGGYPVRAEAFFPSPRTHDEKDVGAGVRMAASALEDRADASSQTGGAGAGLINFGTVTSRSSSVVEKNQVVSTSVTKISDLDLFGFVQIKSLVATAIATSDGAAGAVTGALEIAGMVIKDQAGKEQLKVSLDRTGLHVVYPDGKQEGDPLKALTDAVKQHLEPQGFGITIGQPVDLIDGPTASRSLAGLTFHLDARGMDAMMEDENFPADLRNALRNPTGNQLLGPIFGENGLLSPTVAGFLASFFQGDQTLDFVFGSVAVSAVAAPALPDITIPDLGTPPLTSTPPLDGGIGNGFAPGPTGNGQPGGFTTFGGAPVAVVGVPLTWLLVALAVAIAGSTRLRLFADRVTAAAPAARCLMEEK